MTSATAGVTVSIIRGQELATVQGLSDHWDSLWQRHEHRTAFGLPGWARAWWKAFGAGLNLRCALVTDGNEPMALIPLVRTPDRVLRLLGPPQADYGDMLGDPGRAATALEAVLNVLAGERDWDRIELPNVREDAVLATGLAGLSTRWHRRVSTSPGQACPAAVAGADPVEMYQAFLNKSRVKRTTKKLAALGELKFVHYCDADEAHANLALLFRQQEERSAVAGRRSQFLTDLRERELFHALIDELDPAGTVRFGVLWAGDQPVAGHFGFETPERFIYYKPAFDVDIWDLSPGQVLLAKIFEYCMSRRLRIFDFASGDEDYKFRFANAVPRTFNHVISRHQGGALRRRLTGRVKEVIRQRPRLSRAAQRLREGRWILESDKPPVLVAFECPPGLAGPDLPAARLSDLARLAIAEPERFPASAIGGFRERIRSGQQCVLLKSGGEIEALGWTLVSDGEARLLGWSGPILHDIWIRAAVDATRSALQLAGGVSGGKPLLVLASRGSALAGIAAGLGWKSIGTVPAEALAASHGTED